MLGKAGKKEQTNLIGKYEVEIEKLRDENKWTRLRELVNSIPNKDAKAGIIPELTNIV